MNGPRVTIRRILGPAGPDPGCDRSGDLLDQFVEAELAGRAMSDALREIGTHLEARPDCREDYPGPRALVEATSGEAGGDLA